MQTNPLGIRGVDHFSWTVAEVEPVIAFYERVFGAEVLYRVGPMDTSTFPATPSGTGWSEARLGVADAKLQFAVVRLPGDVLIELFQFMAPGSQTSRPLPNSDIGASHIGIAVDDLEAAARHLQLHGCTVFERIDSPPDSATSGVSYRYFRVPGTTSLSCAAASRRQYRSEVSMTRIPSNPAGLYDSVSIGFSHAVEQVGGRTLHLAGQVAYDSERNIVGKGDLTAQVRQVLENLRKVLAESGATPANLLRIRTYVVNHHPEKLAPIISAIKAFYGDVTPAANTFIGVQSLAHPELLVEIEATAALD